MKFDALCYKEDIIFLNPKCIRQVLIEGYL